MVWYAYATMLPLKYRANSIMRMPCETVPCLMLPPGCGVVSGASAEAATLEGC